MTEYAVGNLFRTNTSVLAEKAAILICASASRRPLAITCDPGGKLMIEPCRTAAEADMVGVYVSGRSRLELAAMIATDLAFERKTRLRAQRRAA